MTWGSALFTCTSVMEYTGWTVFGVFAALLATGSGGVVKTPLEQAALSLDVQYIMEANLDPAEMATSFVRLNNKHTGPILSGVDWEIVFCHKNLISSGSVNKTFGDGVFFDIEHIKGCMHKIKPSSQSPSQLFPPNTPREIKFTSRHLALFKTDAFPNWSIQANGFKSKTLRSTEEVANQAPEDELAFVKLAEESRQKITLTPRARFNMVPFSNDLESVPASLTVPSPLGVVMDENTNNLTFSFGNISWYVIGLGNGSPIKQHILDTFRNVPEIREVHDGDTPGSTVTKDDDATISFNFVPPASFANFTSLQLTNNGSSLVLDECYELEVNKYDSTSAGKIRIDAGSNRAAINALNALRVILGIYNNLPLVKIQDCPRMRHRVFSLDATQNFIPATEIIRLLKAIGTYNINQFHITLGSDHAWIMNISSLPELIQVGSLRCDDVDETDCLYHTMGSKIGDERKYYTEEDFLSILEEAKKQYIKVVPVFNFLGSSRSAVIAMNKRYRTYIQTDKLKAERYYLRQDNDLKNPTIRYEFQDSYFTDGSGVLNPCIKSAEFFVKRVLTDMAELYSKANLKMDTVHIGGDDTQVVYPNFRTCPDNLALIQTGFIKNIANGALPPDVKQLIVREDALTNRLKPEILSMDQHSSMIIVEAWKTNVGTVRSWGLTEAESYFMFRPPLAPVNITFARGAKGIAPGSSPYMFANAGYKVIQAPTNYYRLDAPHVPDWYDRGYHRPKSFQVTNIARVFKFQPENLYANVDLDDVGTRINPHRFCYLFNCPPLMNRENLIGLQACMNTEVIRNGEQVMNMAFPRILGMSERMWRRAPFENLLKPEMNNSIDDIRMADQGYSHFWELEYDNFTNNLRHKELERLDKELVQYNIGKPGCVIGNGFMDAPYTFPFLCKPPTEGLLIQYRQGSSGPWEDLIPFNTTVNYPFDGQLFQFRAMSTDRSRFGLPTNIYSNWNYLTSMVIPLEVYLLLNGTISLERLNSIARYGWQVDPQTIPEVSARDMIAAIDAITPAQAQALEYHLREKRLILREQEERVRQQARQQQMELAEHNRRLGALSEEELRVLQQLQNIPVSQLSPQQQQTREQYAERQNNFINRQRLLTILQTNPEPLTSTERTVLNDLLQRRRTGTLSPEQNIELYFLEQILGIYNSFLADHRARLGQLSEEEEMHLLRLNSASQLSSQEQRTRGLLEQRKYNFGQYEQLLAQQIARPESLNATERRTLYYLQDLRSGVNGLSPEQSFRLHFLERKFDIYDRYRILNMGALTVRQLVTLEELVEKRNASYPLNQTEENLLTSLATKDAAFRQRNDFFLQHTRRPFPEPLSAANARALQSLQLKWSNMVPRTAQDWEEIYDRNMFMEISRIYQEAVADAAAQRGQ